jgi:hypothetical protein
MEKFQIQDKYPGSATLPTILHILIFYSYIGQGDVNATNTAGGLSLQYGSSLPALRPLQLRVQMVFPGTQTVHYGTIGFLNYFIDKQVAVCYLQDRRFVNLDTSWFTLG